MNYFLKWYVSYSVAYITLHTDTANSDYCFICPLNLLVRFMLLCSVWLMGTASTTREGVGVLCDRWPFSPHCFGNSMIHLAYSSESAGHITLALVLLVNR